MERQDGYFSESSLADSVVFKAFNNQAEFSTILNESIKKSTIIESSLIEEQISQMKRTRLSPLVDKVLDAYKNGDIVLLYSKTIRVPRMIPFTVIKIKGEKKAFVFLNNYGNMVEKGKAVGGEYFNIQMKDLYCLMEGAYTSLSYYEYPLSITKNLGLMKLCSSIYTAMILRLLNKDYSLSLEPDMYNRFSFVISKFFLDNIWESKNREVNASYAMNNIPGANKQDLMLLNDSYEAAHITTIEQLIAFFKTITPRVNNLSMRYFTQSYVNTYKDTAIFSMEVLPYFLFALECTLLGSFIVNQPLIMDTLKNTKNVKTFYAELSKVL